LTKVIQILYYLERIIYLHMNKILDKLIFLYGPDQGNQTFHELQNIIQQTHIQDTPREYFNEKDCVLITYADSFSEKDTPPLQTLTKFVNDETKDTINSVHILPFFPYSSDRGFSVIDFYQVKKEFGSWEDMQNLANEKRLMADLVLNHISTQSEWFQKFLDGDPQYQDYFISFREEELNDELKHNLQKVFRPRATPLLTRFETKNGPRYVWTTFSVGDSTDQVDLNYQNPQVLIEVVKILIFLLGKGVRLIRLDAITYVWKELGTNCVHLPQGHAIVQLFRDVLNTICPSAVIVTETNVPHQENISYFGNGTDEAQMVYNFALPPLVLHAMLSEKVDYISNWAKTLTPPSDKTTYFNFLASHDGIGMLGAKGILPESEFTKMGEHMAENGAKVSYRTLENGEKSVYEICATWWSALNDKNENSDVTSKKFLTSHAISLALRGVPGIYYLSLFGKQNYLEGFERTQHTRDINRENLNFTQLSQQLTDQNSKEHKAFKSMKELIKKRTSHPAFHPNAPQTILDLDERVFAILRESEKENMLTLHNVSGDTVSVTYRDQTHTLAPYSHLWQPMTKL
jgi:glycosidase